MYQNRIPPQVMALANRRNPQMAPYQKAVQDLNAYRNSGATMLPQMTPQRAPVSIAGQQFDGNGQPVQQVSPQEVQQAQQAQARGVAAALPQNPQSSLPAGSAPAVPAVAPGMANAPAQIPPSAQNIPPQVRALLGGGGYDPRSYTNPQPMVR